jgi:hypothetical protein
MLVEIAKETVEIHRKISPSDGQRPWSVIQVYYSKVHTWSVYIRESGAARGFTVEIDLNRKPSSDVDNPEAFPVRIWL